MTGRPSKYNPGIHTQLAYWMAKNGLTDVQIAEQLHISVRTLDNWKIRHSEFMQSVKKGKDQIDVLAQGSLLQRALGYEYEEIHRERVTIKVDGGPDRSRMVVTKKIRKHVHPEVIALIFWLKNRCPKEWRDRKALEITGEGGEPLKVRVVFPEGFKGV
ncbi:hypothetical protein LCGC14_2331660 [marine sediment metagenome]|uniref:Homeodomain phBC6A51-type domain-containing protein n=1 Tax=marine sediment metagenome TaxID=412755 RepID=A0A0F9ESE6_9ZZZZ